MDKYNFKNQVWIFVSLPVVLCLFHCKSGTSDAPSKTTEEVSEPKIKIIPQSKPDKTVDTKPIPETWKEITTDATGIILDIRYATTNNFTKKQIYDCAKCFMRPEATAKLIQIHNELNKKYGFGLKVYDCFRPRPYQQRLWDIVPDPSYVTPPAKGSMHSRGLAVDLTIVDSNGKELDMGTSFDFFGPEAHQDYTKLSDDIKKNRQLLKSTMIAYGFSPIRTEWWHYSLNGFSYHLDEWVWSCM